MDTFTLIDNSSRLTFMRILKRVSQLRVHWNSTPATKVTTVCMIDIYDNAKRKPWHRGGQMLGNTYCFLYSSQG